MEDKISQSVAPKVKTQVQLTVSKEITVRLKPTGTAFAKRNPDVISFTKQIIGGSVNGKNCMTPEEHNHYFPSIFGMTPASENWESRLTSYWASIRRNVPKDTGLKLQIGFIYKDAECLKAGKTCEESERYLLGMPIKREDYILWRYLLIYTHCANSPEEIYGNNPNIRFYIEDPQVAERKEAEGLVLRKKARKDLDKVIADPDLMNNILAVAGSDKDGNYYDLGKMTITQKELALEKLANDSPERFSSIVNDPSLLMKAFIERCISTPEVRLRRLPSTDTIIYGDNTILGDNIQDVIARLSDTVNKENVQIYTTLKAQLTAIK